MSTRGRSAVGRKRYAAPALEKGLDILELLAEEPAGLSLKQVAQRLGRSPSELFRMLSCLQQRRYIDRREAGDMYTLTTQLFELAHRYPPTRLLLEASLSQMRQVAGELGQSCHLSIMSGSSVLVLGQAESPNFQGFSVRVGGKMPVNQTTSGPVLLAWAEPAAAREVLQSLPASVREPVEVQAEQIRRRGYERRRSRSVLGIIDLSCPVIDCAGHAVGAITIPFLWPLQDGMNGHSAKPNRHDRIDAALHRLQRAASTVSTMIGGTGFVTSQQVQAMSAKA